MSPLTDSMKLPTQQRRIILPHVTPLILAIFKIFTLECNIETNSSSATATSVLNATETHTTIVVPDSTCQIEPASVSTGEPSLIHITRKNPPDITPFTEHEVNSQ